MDKGALTLLLPISARKQLIYVSDDVATKVSLLYYYDASDALPKALAD